MVPKDISLKVTQGIQWLYDRLIDPHNATLSVEERQRVIMFNTLMLLFVPFAPLVTLSVTDFSGTEAHDPLSLIVTIVGALGLLMCYPLHRSGRYRLARWVTVVIAVLLVLAQTQLSNPPYADVLYLLAIPTAAVMFFSRRDIVVLSAGITVLILASLLTKPDATYDTRTDFVTLSILLTLLVVITSYYRDVLERQRSRLLVEQETALRMERERTRILHDFIQTASHDLRTPLTIINTSAALLERATDPERRTYHVNKLTNSVTTMEKILDRIFYTIGLDGLAPDAMRDVRLSDVLHHLADNVALEAEARGLRFEREISDPLPTLRAHGDDLGNALAELMRNALANTPPGGLVRLSGRREEDEIVIQIVDTGKGIPSAALARVFDLFYRVESHRPLEERQIGLGLPIARKIIGLHGGTIAIDSIEGEGTTVTLKIPLSGA